ncbi:FadR/GntR family transcriptional regulator [Chachezhania antarctica]|uniref:FadR/GntR family transcriptional regulator n=1 Tax=Chachezhania antarctica TaxID=2340860 RepID=UPI000EAF1400|nr:FCD domain-containing protein [Chachezhania antarctica]|tara:strand:+ start:537 stop:1238 length:702 start_codon:yes stop_codon:yes gene_type:complete
MNDATQDSPEDITDLRQALKEMSMQSGGLPPERQLAKDLNVPRSRLRRALADLRDEGELPPAKPGRRAVRQEASRIEGFARVANPTDVIELRILLEPNFARLAAIRASALEIARITRAATTRPEESYGGADLAFHQEVARGSRNALAVEFYRLLREVGTDSRVRLPSRKPLCPDRRATRDREHMEIARAIAERDPDRAEAAMRAHLANVQRLIHERLTPDPSEDSARLTGSSV